MWSLLFVVSVSVYGKVASDECVTRQEVSDMKKTLSNLTTRLQEVEARTLTQRQDPLMVAGGISFAVTLSKSRELHYNESIVFDTVLLDTFGSYDPNTGVFTVPVYGVYFFSATVTTPGYAPFGTGIVRNGTFVAHMMAQSNVGGGQGSTSLTMNLYPGDRIWVSTDQFSSGQLLTKLGWNVFTGFQLNSSIE